MVSDLRRQEIVSKLKGFSKSTALAFIHEMDEMKNSNIIYIFLFNLMQCLK